MTLPGDWEQLAGMLTRAAEEFARGHRARLAPGPLADPAAEAARQAAAQILDEAIRTADDAHRASMNFASALTDWFDVLRKVQTGDLTVRAQGPYGDEFLDKLGEMLNRALASLRALDEERREHTERELRQARAVAEQRDRLAAIGELTAGVAHEIRSPLAYVRSNLDAMKSHLEELAAALATTPLPPAVGTDAARLLHALTAATEDSQHGIRRTSVITRALQGVARGHADERIQFDPGKSVNDAVTVFRGGRTSDCEVRVVLASLPSVAGSPGALAQVVLNLLHNAVDAAGDGAVEVGGETTAAGEARLWVRNGGPGIPEAARPHIFEPFFTTKPPGRGTGLGLYICWGVVKDMGGSIGFDTGAHGTTFHVVLPPAPTGGG